VRFISTPPFQRISTFVRIFASLAADKSQAVPYDRDIADNRRKYGDGMLRKAEEHLANQRRYEAETQARLAAARQRRREDKERQEAIEVRRFLPSIGSFH
jgi:RNA polymerase-associated protein CTR9